MSNNNTESLEAKRGREWVFILYPESAPKDWETQLKELHITFVISPLHDKDINPDGTLKKPHYHVLLSYNSVKSFNQVKQITNLLNQPLPQICHNKTSQIRYFIHIDDQDKYQYSRSDIKTYGQIDLDTYFKHSFDEEIDMVDAILDYCEINNIDEFFELVNYCRKNNRDWWRYLNKNCWLIKETLKSKHFHKKEKRMETMTSGTNTEKLLQQLEDM